jgi:hypothetical protein
LDPPDHPVTWLGGPATLIIFDGFALYLERGNRFSRVVGPGKEIPFLELYETVRAIVDIRPRVKNGRVSAWTKDGIYVKLMIRLECGIGPVNQTKLDESLVYPYDPLAVRKIVERTAVKFDPVGKKLVEEQDWINTAWGQATGTLADYMASRYLDDLFLAERKGGQILAPETGKQLLMTLNDKLQGFGLHALSLQITEVEFPEQVKTQRLRTWETERKNFATITEGEIEAYRIRAREKARAEAQRDLILTIANGLQKMDPSRFPEPLLLSLAGILDQSLGDPLVRTYLARESLETLEKMQGLLKFQFWLPGGENEKRTG